MQLTLTLTASTLAAIGKVLDCRKSVLLSGHGAYIDQQAQFAAVHALDLLMQDNGETTGFNQMMRDVAAEEADVDGQFAAMRTQSAIERDAHGDNNKVHVAHLKQVLAAVKLERQFAQTEVAA